jgi:hypothetical protein
MRINPDVSVTTAMPAVAVYPNCAANQPPTAEPMPQAVARTAQKMPIPTPSPKGAKRAVKPVPLTIRKGQQSSTTKKLTISTKQSRQNKIHPGQEGIHER